MNIETDIQTLDKLLAPRPKIVFAESDHKAARDLLNGSLNGDAILDYLVFRPAVGASAAGLRELSGLIADSAAMQVPAPPSAICVLAALTDDGHAQLREFTAWWSGRNAGAAPPVLDLRNGHQPADTFAMKSALFQRLFEIAHLELRRTDERVSELHGALYELRTEYEQARGVMRRIQEFLPQIAPFRLIESFPPSDKLYSEGQSPPRVLRQPLPTSAAGLAAIDLYSPPGTNGAIGSGNLSVTLQCLESGMPVAIWRIPYHRLGQGWFRCAFPVASSSQAHHLELIAKWETESGEPPRLALSPVGAYPEMLCRSDASQLAGGLAMALWGTLPGTNLNLPAHGWCTISGTSPKSLAIEYALDANDIVRIKPTVNIDVQYVHPLNDVTGFRLHPMESGPATAILSNICMASTDRVICVAQIRNPEARSVIEYAMCLTPARLHCRSFPTSPENDPGVVGYSGWQAVAADQQPHAVTLLLDRPLSEPADLHFATRMKDGAPTSYGWADWLEVRVRVRHETSGGSALPVDAAGSA